MGVVLPVVLVLVLVPVPVPVPVVPLATVPPVAIAVSSGGGSGATFGTSTTAPDSSAGGAGTVVTLRADGAPALPPVLEAEPWPEEAVDADGAPETCGADGAVVDLAIGTLEWPIPETPRETPDGRGLIACAPPDRAPACPPPLPPALVPPALAAAEETISPATANAAAKPQPQASMNSDFLYMAPSVFQVPPDFRRCEVSRDAPWSGFPLTSKHTPLRSVRGRRHLPLTHAEALRCR